MRPLRGRECNFVYLFILLQTADLSEVAFKPDSHMLKKKFLLVPALIIFGLFFLISCQEENSHENNWQPSYLAHLELGSTTLVATAVAENMEVPWEVTWGPDDKLWFTEQNGSVYRMDVESGERKKVLQVPDIHYQKSRGLLGMALHPELPEEPYVFLHYTYLKSDDVLDKEIESRVVRYTLERDTLVSPKILLDEIPGQTYHNGSRLLISPDEKLFFAMGDAGRLDQVLDSTTLVGKIHRLNLDGSIPKDNPLPGNPVWSWGHRNVQGMVWTGGKLYASEHGPANDDEINLIRPGRNYGWPKVHGYCDLENEQEYCETHQVVEPLAAWTPTIAVAGLDYYDHPAVPEWQNSLLVVNLKGQALRVLPLSDDGEQVREKHIFFQKHFGRLRDLAVAPNGDLYLATSNRDWHPRFQPFLYDTASLIHPADDRIIRLQAATPADREILAALDNPVALQENPEAAEMPSEQWNITASEDRLSRGAALYQQHCALCHRPDGQGVEDLYPPLAGTNWVTGSKDRLINVLLRGLSEPIEVNGKTYEEAMAPYAHLPDEELAAILSFIRQSWGNEAGAVLPAEVREERRLLGEVVH